MRQGQHPKKNRGRSRRQPNPVNRLFESNGPDVKIRGNASHISEKYLVLARDAQSSGDPISAENYLQHAEHYLRIIAAANVHQQTQSSPCSPDQGERGANGRGNGHGQGSGQESGSMGDEAEDGGGDADDAGSASAVSDAESDDHNEAAYAAAEADEEARDAG
jgi:hypothetical protein